MLRKRCLSTVSIQKQGASGVAALPRGGLRHHAHPRVPPARMFLSVREGPFRTRVAYAWTYILSRTACERPRPPSSPLTGGAAGPSYLENKGL